jgi:hypothetical protein
MTTRNNLEYLDSQRDEPYQFGEIRPENETPMSPSFIAEAFAPGMSLVLGIDGPRGGGKSLLLTLLDTLDMGNGLRCKSNLPIAGEVWNSAGKKVRVQSEELDYIRLVSTIDQMWDYIVSIDEINLLFDALDFQRNGSKMFHKFMQQIRKRRVSIYYTLQNFRWADNRIRWQTDILVSCMDMYFYPAFREKGLERGQLIEIKARDLSGVLTGQAYDAENNPQVFYGRFLAEPMWDYYDSGNIISAWENQVNVKYKKPTIEVDLTGEGDGGGAQATDMSPAPETETEGRTALKSYAHKRKKAE